MENQEKLNNKVGTKETKKLEPVKVKIEGANVEFVEKAKGDKIVCSVKHPDREETIKISKVKYESNGKLLAIGLWYKEDEDGLISKNSALAHLMNYLNAETISDLKDNEIMTTEDEEGYLCFKAY